MSKLDEGWRRLVTEIGVEFMSDRALELFRQAGQRVEDKTVFLDPEFVLAQVAKAPQEFDVVARATPPTRCTSAATRWPSARSTVHLSCGRARCAATRPWTTSATSPGWRSRSTCSTRRAGVICEPNDTPLDSRHLDMTYALQTLTDKIYMGNVVSGVNAVDTIAMGSILFGGRT